MLPPGWLVVRDLPKQDRLGLLDEGNGIYSLYRPDGMCILDDAPGREYALMMLESQIETHIPTLRQPDSSSSMPGWWPTPGGRS